MGSVSDSDSSSGEDPTEPQEDEKNKGMVYGFVDFYGKKGSEDVKYMYVIDQPTVAFGRDHGCNIRLNNMRVSRHHVDLILKFNEEDERQYQAVLHNRTDRPGTLIIGKQILVDKFILEDQNKFCIQDLEFRWRIFNPKNPSGQLDIKIPTPKKRLSRGEMPPSRRPPSRRSTRSTSLGGGESSQNGSPKSRRRRSNDLDLRKAVLQKSLRKSGQGISSPTSQDLFASSSSILEEVEAVETEHLSESESLIKFSSSESSPSADLINFDSSREMTSDRDELSIGALSGMERNVPEAETIQNLFSVGQDKVNSTEEPNEDAGTEEPDGTESESVLENMQRVFDEDLADSENNFPLFGNDNAIIGAGMKERSTLEGEAIQEETQKIEEKSELEIDETSEIDGAESESDILNASSVFESQQDETDRIESAKENKSGADNTHHGNDKETQDETSDEAFEVETQMLSGDQSGDLVEKEENNEDNVVKVGTTDEPNAGTEESESILENMQRLFDGDLMDFEDSFPSVGNDNAIIGSGMDERSTLEGEETQEENERVENSKLEEESGSDILNVSKAIENQQNDGGTETDTNEEIEAGVESAKENKSDGDITHLDSDKETEYETCDEAFEVETQMLSGDQSGDPVEIERELEKKEDNEDNIVSVMLSGMERNVPEAETIQNLFSVGQDKVNSTEEPNGDAGTEEPESFLENMQRMFDGDITESENNFPLVGNANLIIGAEVEESIEGEETQEETELIEKSKLEEESGSDILNDCKDSGKSELTEKHKIRLSDGSTFDDSIDIYPVVKLQRMASNPHTPNPIPVENQNGGYDEDKIEKSGVKSKSKTRRTTRKRGAREIEEDEDETNEVPAPVVEKPKPVKEKKLRANRAREELDEESEDTQESLPKTSKPLRATKSSKSHIPKLSETDKDKSQLTRKHKIRLSDGSSLDESTDVYPVVKIQKMASEPRTPTLIPVENRNGGPEDKIEKSGVKSKSRTRRTTRKRGAREIEEDEDETNEVPAPVVEKPKPVKEKKLRGKRAREELDEESEDTQESLPKTSKPLRATKSSKSHVPKLSETDKDKSQLSRKHKIRLSDGSRLDDSIDIYPVVKIQKMTSETRIPVPLPTKTRNSIHEEDRIEKPRVKSRARATRTRRAREIEEDDEPNESPAPKAPSPKVDKPKLVKEKKQTKNLVKRNEEESALSPKTRKQKIQKKSLREMSADPGTVSDSSVEILSVVRKSSKRREKQNVSNIVQEKPETRGRARTTRKRGAKEIEPESSNEDEPDSPPAKLKKGKPTTNKGKKYKTKREEETVQTVSPRRLRSCASRKV